MPEVSIIIVNWNGGDLLRRCVESIIQNPPSVPYEIIVVDNASTDHSVSWVRSCGVNLRLIENRENLGFGKANNQGIANSDAPLLFLLNNDAQVGPGAIDKLIGTLRSDERIGACGPRLINPDGSLQVSVWRNPFTAWYLLFTLAGLYRLIPKPIRGELLLEDYWDHARRRRVNMLKGAAILAKREMVDAVGGFDERFFMYGEDNEWCLRIVRAGWWLIFEPGAVVTHYGGHGTKQRWGSLEDSCIRLDAYFRFQRHCLTRRQAITNQLTWCLVLRLQQVYRKLKGYPTDGIKMALKLHFNELKRIIRKWETS